jgi:hypothetical protein
MTGLEKAAEEYLARRRAVGFKLTGAGLFMADFAAYLGSNGAQMHKLRHQGHRLLKPILGGNPWSLATNGADQHSHLIEL